jgi:hypothetical protein
MIQYDENRLEGPSERIIQMSKPMMWDKKHKWNWHKTWNLPEVVVQWPLKDKCLENIGFQNKIKVEIFAITVTTTYNNKLHYEKAALEGIVNKVLSPQEIISFSSLHFGATSHVLKDSRISLVVIMTQYTTETKFKQLPPIAGFVSPSIFVDSRKSIRDSREIKKEKQESKLFETFCPREFSRIYTKKGSTGRSLKIPNDFEGLLDYLTAHNIKNKIKHPVFLAEMFSSCVKLFFNTNVLNPSDEDNGSKTLPLLQETLSEIQSQNHTKHKESISSCSEIASKSFVMLIESTVPHTDHFGLFKIIYDHLIQLNHGKLYLTVERGSIPHYFKCIEWPSISQVYSKCFSKNFHGRQQTQQVAISKEIDANTSDNTDEKQFLDGDKDAEESTSESLNIVPKIESTQEYSSIPSKPLNPSDGLAAVMIPTNNVPQNNQNGYDAKVYGYQRPLNLNFLAGDQLIQVDPYFQSLALMQMELKNRNQMLAHRLLMQQLNSQNNNHFQNLHQP